METWKETEGPQLCSTSRSAQAPFLYDSKWHSHRNVLSVFYIPIIVVDSMDNYIIKEKE